MGLTVKFRFAYYKQFETDIWGLFKSTLYIKDWVNANKKMFKPSILFQNVIESLHNVNFYHKKIKRIVSKVSKTGKVSKVSKAGKIDVNFFIKTPQKFALFYSLFLNYKSNIYLRDFLKTELYLYQFKNKELMQKIKNLIYINFLSLQNWINYNNLLQKIDINSKFNIIKSSSFLKEFNSIKIKFLDFIKSVVKKIKVYDFKLQLVISKNKFEINEIVCKVKINFYKEYESRKLEKLCKFFYSLYQEKNERILKRTRRYIYRIDVIDPEHRKKPLSKKFVTIRILRLYYLIYSYRQLRKMAKKIIRREGQFEVNWILALEGRLINAVYRTGLTANVFESIEIVYHGHFLINQSRLGHFYHSVRLTDLLAFSISYKWILYYRVLTRISRRTIMFSPPKYMFVSYKLLLAYFKRTPKSEDLVFPTNIDIFRAIGYGYSNLN